METAKQANDIQPTFGAGDEVGDEAAPPSPSYLKRFGKKVHFGRLPQRLYRMQMANIAIISTEDSSSPPRLPLFHHSPSISLFLSLSLSLSLSLHSFLSPSLSVPPPLAPCCPATELPLSR